MIEQQHAYNEREAARYLGVSDAALRLWRSRGEGPRFFRAGEKLVRYRRADLDSWIEARLSEPTPADCGITGLPGGRRSSFCPGDGATSTKVDCHGYMAASAEHAAPKM